MATITIDGPAGAGKTTIAKMLSEKLGYIYFNTGAIYRAIAFKYMQNRFDPENSELLKQFVNSLNIIVKYEGVEQLIISDDKNVTQSLFVHELDKLSSDLSRYKEVREYAVKLQRDCVKGHNVILEGRDTGSVVIPDAEFKFYLTANAKIRAERRLKQYIDRGDDMSKISYEKILEDIISRDKTDTERKLSPLIVPKGATFIDASNLTVAEVAAVIYNVVKGK